MLDDLNIIKNRDSQNAIDVAAKQWEQAKFDAQILHGDHDGREINNIVIAGMGGSALAALILKNWLEQEYDKPIEIVRNYTLPQYVDSSTLVICSSYSGNTEETLSTLEDAKSRNAQIAITTSGGQLDQIAQDNDIVSVKMPNGLQPRMAVIYNLKSLCKILNHFGLLDESYYNEIGEIADWLKEESKLWHKDVSTDQNPAKQIALIASGKTSVFYAGHLMSPIAYKWKISWNETAKNTAFYNEFPEFNHNEFMGWASHPVEKPFAVFDLISDLEHPRINTRFEITDRILSGKRPSANIIRLHGETKLKQMLWGCILADFSSIYASILNGVDPTPVDLIEKLKIELRK